jgi:hypothetical protein
LYHHPTSDPHPAIRARARDPSPHTRALAMLARLVARAARSPKRVEQISRARSMSSGASVEEEIGASRARTNERANRTIATRRRCARENDERARLTR